MWNKGKTKLHRASQAVAEETVNRAARELSDGTGGDLMAEAGFSKNGVATVLVNPNGPAKVVDVHACSNYYNTCQVQKK